jgi:hypothetical protein
MEISSLSLESFEDVFEVVKQAVEQIAASYESTIEQESDAQELFDKGIIQARITSIADAVFGEARPEGTDLDDIPASIQARADEIRSQREVFEKMTRNFLVSRMVFGE